MSDHQNNLAQSLLSKMTYEEKIGQLFVARCPQGDGTAADAIKKYKLGGFTLYAVDFENETKDSAKAKIESYQNASSIPMFIAVDEEGGNVTRVSKYAQFRKTPFPSPATLYNEGGIDAILRDLEEKASLLRSLGINFNYAPVCDLATSPDNFIYHRTLGRDVTTTCEYISAVVTRMNELKLVGSIKHFPGYGDNVDTHQLIAHDSRKLSDFEERDLLPFISGIKAGAPIVMVAHNIVECLDASCPASLSPKVNKYLREKLGFDGIVMTDSLDMNAITLYTEDRAAAVAAILAGNHLLCCSSYAVQFEAVSNAVKNGTISMERIEESVLKILKLKISMGIIK